MQPVDAVRRHPDSPRGPELRDPARFLAALRASLPSESAPAGTELHLEFENDVDATGAVTRVVADAVSDPVVRAALIAALMSAAFHPAWHDQAAVAVSGLHVKLGIPVRDPR